MPLVRRHSTLWDKHESFRTERFTIIVNGFSDLYLG